MIFKRPNSPLPVIEKIPEPFNDVEEYSFTEPGLFDHELLEIDDLEEISFLSQKLKNSIIDDDEDELEVPEFEINFSFNEKSDDSNINSHNDSVFVDW